jgi:hypothetical protein
MANNYLLKPKLNTLKQSFFLEDEMGNVVYESKMTKFSLFGASPYEFYNHKTNKVEEHKVGKTVTIEQGGNSLISVLSKKSYFKYDGKNIWDYLHDLGIRIENKPSSNKIGMTYEISLEGKPLGTVATSSPKGKSFITTDLYYDVICEEEDLDLMFLTAFSIAKTEQTFYN